MPPMLGQQQGGAAAAMLKLRVAGSGVVRRVKLAPPPESLEALEHAIRSVEPAAARGPPDPDVQLLLVWIRSKLDPGIPLRSDADVAQAFSAPSVELVLETDRGWTDEQVRRGLAPPPGLGLYAGDHHRAYYQNRHKVPDGWCPPRFEGEGPDVHVELDAAVQGCPPAAAVPAHELLQSRGANVISAVGVTFTVNGRSVTIGGGDGTAAGVSPRLLLVDVLRDTLGLMGTKIGCGEGGCGACTVLLSDAKRWPAGPVVSSIVRHCRSAVVPRSI
eukprot:SAG22_NODE_371_length_11566_cov_5.447458_14_plen_274_part_00